MSRERSRKADPALAFLAAGRGALRKRGTDAGARFRAYVTLRTALRDAVRMRILPSNPAADIQRPKKPKPTRRVFTPQELAVFLEFVAEDEDFALWRFLAATGARVGEALALREDDFDFERGEVRIGRTIGRDDSCAVRIHEETKSAAGMRTIDVDPATLDATRVQIARNKERRAKNGVLWNAERLVFPSRAGKPRAEKSITGERFPRLSRSFLEATKIEPVRGTHGFRHTHATILLANRWSPPLVAARLGHSVETLLTTYGGVIPGDAKAASDFLASLIDSTPTTARVASIR